MLCKWGIDEARKRGVPALVESSSKAHPLYKRCGFEDILIHKFDLSKWGDASQQEMPVMMWKPDSGLESQCQQTA